MKTASRVNGFMPLEPGYATSNLCLAAAAVTLIRNPSPKPVNRNPSPGPLDPKPQQPQTPTTGKHPLGDP